MDKRYMEVGFPQYEAEFTYNFNWITYKITSYLSLWIYRLDNQTYRRDQYPVWIAKTSHTAGCGSRLVQGNQIQKDELQPMGEEAKSNGR